MQNYPKMYAELKKNAKASITEEEYGKLTGLQKGALKRWNPENAMFQDYTKSKKKRGNVTCKYCMHATYRVGD